MIKSMTGFGRGSFSGESLEFDIEIKSLNSKFFELKIRGFSLSGIEEIKLRKFLKEKIIRGSVNLAIKVNGEEDQDDFVFNKKKVDAIQNILNDIHIHYGQRLGLGDIISSNDLIKSKISNINLSKFLFSVLEKAIKELDEMRIKEGKLIYKDIFKRIKKSKNMLGNISKISEKYSSEKQEILSNKVQNLINGSKIDENRLIQELAYYVEKSDITEEIVRCKSHFNQLESYLKLDNAVGKRIIFIIQEILREVNTIGSKSHQIELIKQAVEIKDQLEKIREQSHNIL
ncbi:MAG: hypothetical protein CMG04_05345 [Candidatus Marinimicrobia bacterium]|nr:hypothetical protein [Candidatus Neomarinimicrobiota bacterium]